MFWVYVEFSIVISLLGAYFALYKIKNLNKLIVLFSGFVILQYTASFVGAVNILFAHNYIDRSYANVNTYPLIYLVFVALTSVLIKKIINLLEKKFILPFQGWFKHIFLFLSTAFLGFFLVLHKFYQNLYFLQLFALLVIASLFLFSLTYNFVYIRKMFLKYNIETSYMLTFCASILFIALL